MIPFSKVKYEFLPYNIGISWHHVLAFKFWRTHVEISAYWKTLSASNSWCLRTEECRKADGYTHRLERPHTRCVSYIKKKVCLNLQTFRHIKRTFMQTCSDSWTCSWRFLMTASSSNVLPSTPEAVGRAWSCFSTDSLSSAWSLKKVFRLKMLCHKNK